MERKLDLSRLTDEEAKHIWEVIQRDFNLRKKEEERLGELKNQIEKEGTKRELLGCQSNITDSLCIRCLQPFKFLVNSKRQCLDCHMYTCKSCSRYNKKEHGWVCDNCRMTRVLKIGTLGWYHDNVRNRFKHFGSAKVMRSLYKRLNGDGGRDDDTQSMPDVHRYVYNGTEDDPGDAEAQRYKMMRKSKRLLSVHPMDFDTEDYLPYSRRPSMQMQEERFYRNEMDYDYNNHRGNRRKSLDRYAIRPGQYTHKYYITYTTNEFGDSRMFRTRSLSKITSAVARQQYIDTSDEEEYQRYPSMYQQPPHRRRGSRASSQENLGQAPPINELSKRMSAIESLLSRLEEKMTPGDETSGLSNEEEALRKKMSELAGNLSDKGPSLWDEATKKSFSVGKGPTARGFPSVSLRDKGLSSSSDEAPTEAQKRSTAAALCDLTTEVLRTINATENAMIEYGLSEPAGRPQLVSSDLKQADDSFRELEENVYITASQSYELESKLRRLEQSAKNHFGGTTDSELSELEDVVALTAARVQSAESEVSDIESKIAALSTAGGKKKVPFRWTEEAVTTFAVCKKKFSYSPILAQVDPALQCLVELDASDLEPPAYRRLEEFPSSSIIELAQLLEAADGLSQKLSESLSHQHLESLPTVHAVDLASVGSVEDDVDDANNVWVVGPQSTVSRPETARQERSTAASVATCFISPGNATDPNKEVHGTKRTLLPPQLSTLCP
ncbi:melanophilin a [Pholidichthys leucotaenia]